MLPSLLCVIKFTLRELLLVIDCLWCFACFASVIAGPCFAFQDNLLKDTFLYLPLHLYTYRALREIFAEIHRHQQRAKQQQTRYRKTSRPHASGLHQEASSITSTEDEEDEEEEGEEERGIGEGEKGKREECDYEVRLSFLQIYRETIQDLLSPWNVMEVGR